MIPKSIYKTVVRPNLSPCPYRTFIRFIYRTVFYRDRDRYRTVFYRDRDRYRTVF